jgi:hypothetical protein
MDLGTTQPLTEMSTSNLPGYTGWPARKADNLTAICEPIVLGNEGTSMSHNLMDLQGPITRIALPFYPEDLHHQHRTEADVPHLILLQTGYLDLPYVY